MKDQMNSRPIDPILNQERLSDFAQFAVSDSHDLWPRIERDAHSSATDITTTRPGILSLSLSRAWTAVGILLIAATFAILGLGLVVLVLSNGHDQVPAAQPDSTVTPTPTGTAIPAAVVPPKAAPTPGIESAAAGEGPSGSQTHPDESTPSPEPKPEPTPTPEHTETPTANPISTPDPTVTPPQTSTPTPTTTPTSHAHVNPYAPTDGDYPTATATPPPTSTPTPEPTYANVTVSENPDDIYYWTTANGSTYKVHEIRDPAPASEELDEGTRLVAIDVSQRANVDNQEHSPNLFSVQDVDKYVYSANALTSLWPLFGEGRLNSRQTIRGWVSFTLPDSALIEIVRAKKNRVSPPVEIAGFIPFVGLNLSGRTVQVRLVHFERVTGTVSFSITTSLPECMGDDFGKMLTVRPPYQQLITYETTLPATCTRGNPVFEATAYINGREQASATTTYALP